MVRLTRSPTPCCARFHAARSDASAALRRSSCEKQDSCRSRTYAPLEPVRGPGKPVGEDHWREDPGGDGPKVGSLGESGLVGAWSSLRLINKR